MPTRLTLTLLVALGLFGSSGCSSPSARELSRTGDEIMVCGRLFHTGAPVVLWTDPGGYDAYRSEKRFVPWDKAAWTPIKEGEKNAGPGSPNRTSIRFAPGAEGGVLSPDDFERIRGGGWDLATLQNCVDQFVLHYDVCGVSRQCFRILHDIRGLSVQFMLDIDGTIYQTVDLKENAWHATSSNSRSVGVEIANIGAYAEGEKDPFAQWYAPISESDPDRVRITIPQTLGDGGVRTPNFVGVPATRGLVTGEIQGQRLRMHDLTSEQYESLIRLTAALCTIFPNIACDYPRDEQGQLLTRALDKDALKSYRGILGHYHIQTNKTDPGPAIQWERLVREARTNLGIAPGNRVPDRLKLRAQSADWAHEGY